LEVRNAVDEQAAHAVMAVVDMNLIALAPQLFRRREAAGAGADDADGEAELLARGEGLHPALVPGGIRDVALHRADGHRIEARLDDAIALAQPVLRADAAADLGEVVGGARNLV